MFWQNFQIPCVLSDRNLFLAIFHFSCAVGTLIPCAGGPKWMDGVWCMCVCVWGGGGGGGPHVALSNLRNGEVPCHYL